MTFLYDFIFGMGVTALVAILALLLVFAFYMIANSRDERKNAIKVYEVIVRVYYGHGKAVKFEYIQAKNKQEVWQELCDRYEGCPHNYQVERVRKCK